MQIRLPDFNSFFIISGVLCQSPTLAQMELFPLIQIFKELTYSMPYSVNVFGFHKNEYFSK